MTNNSGTNDVQDCQQAVEDCLAQFQNLNKEKLLLYGGSHGGYLVLHLSGQYPDTYKVTIIRHYSLIIYNISNNWQTHTVILQY